MGNELTLIPTGKKNVLLVLMRKFGPFWANQSLGPIEKGLGLGLEKWVRLTNMGSSSDWNLIKLASVRFQICLVSNFKKMMFIFVTRSVKSHARIVGAMNSVIGSLVIISENKGSAIR